MCLLHAAVPVRRQVLGCHAACRSLKVYLLPDCLVDDRRSHFMRGQQAQQHPFSLHQRRMQSFSRRFYWHQLWRCNNELCFCPRWLSSGDNNTKQRRSRECAFLLLGSLSDLWNQRPSDSKCRFTYIAVAGPGVMADRDAIDQCSLGEKISKLPFPYVSIGDAAYTVSEKLIAIFFGQRRMLVRYDNFNYFASQLRIRIEMAFGLMTSKWGILKEPLRIKVSKIWKLVVAIARLHNFCINQRLNDGITEAETNMSSVIPSTPQAADGTPIVQDDGSIVSRLRPANIMGESATREWMVNEIANAGLVRPGRPRR